MPRNEGARIALRPTLAAALCLVTLALGACAGTSGAFATKYPDNVEADLAVLLKRLADAPPRSEGSIAVGVTSEPKRLYAYDLVARRVRWDLPANPRVAPLLAGDAVITHEGESIVARELKSGQRRFAMAAEGMTLVAADGDESNVVLTLSSGMGTYAKSRVVVWSGSSERWERTLSAPVGAPALVGNVVLVPWSNQFLSALTLDDGEEFARMRAADGVIAHAFADRGHVYTGSQHGIAQLTQAIASGTLKAGPYLAAPQEDLPGRPLFLRDVYAQAPLPPPDSAQNRIGLTWVPEPRDAKSLTLAGGNLYLFFYRFVFALDPSTLGLRWIYAHERDLVGARAQPNGVVIADIQGEMRFLFAHSGKTAWFEGNGLPSLVVELPSQGNSLGMVDDTSEPDPESVRTQLLAAAQDADARLVPMRLLAIELLAKLDDADATANLLGLCDDERTTAPVRKAACNALKDRKTGTDALLVALERHASYLDGTTAPPVGALAKAAAAQKESRAVPLLVSHLQDPATPPQTLSAIVTSLGDLGDKSAAPALDAFLRLYHADPIDEHLTRALELVPDALVRLLGADARPVLVATSQDRMSAGSVRERARRALVTLDDQEKVKEKTEETEKLAADKAAVEQVEAAEKPKVEPIPTRLTVDLVKQVLAPARAELQACIVGVKPELFQARLVLVVEDGELLMLSVVPESLQSCIEPIVRKQEFPRTQSSKRESLSYTVKRY